MSGRIYRFDNFELFAAESELRAGNSSIRLQEKPLQLLIALVEKPQQVVTRAELRERLWESHIFVDYEQGINVAIRKLRDALGDSAENPKFIQTIAKKGYRFRLAVHVSDPEEPTGVVARDAPPRQEEIARAFPGQPSGKSHSARSRWKLAVLALVVLSVLGAWLYGARLKARGASQIHSLAVLPLRDLSPDPGQEYFADGITEEVIANLAQSLPLRVISRTSVMRYKEPNEPVREIARKLGVEAIVEGAVARSGNRVTVTIQLIDATEDRHLWAQTYDRNVGDLLSLEAELSHQIAKQVGATLDAKQGVREAKSRAVDPQVHELYLKGRYFWNKRTDDGVRKAAEYFQQAVDLDPNYPQGYIGLADCYLFGQQPRSLGDLAPRAEAMATKALEIDEGAGEAHATLGLLAQNSELDWARAEREFKRAIDLNPNYATAHHWYGEHLALRGKFDDALLEMKLANDLDPLSLVIIKDTGEVYYLARQYDQALEYFRKVVDMDPGFVLAHRSIGMVYLQKRDFSAGIAEFQKAKQLEDVPDSVTELGYAFAVSGRREEAERALQDLRKASERRFISPDRFAVVYAGLGDKDRAFQWLEKTYREGGLLTGLKVDPRWDKLRTDPRFGNLLKRVGLGSD
jgi:TolB-like protein/DNA-binding winged helix-turn-helix (wHTH) protein/Tfp pilus assembly protein PilF